jgi:hypothetical protein
MRRLRRKGHRLIDRAGVVDATKGGFIRLDCRPRLSEMAQERADALGLPDSTSTGDLHIGVVLRISQPQLHRSPEVRHAEWSVRAIPAVVGRTAAGCSMALRNARLPLQRSN